MVQLIAKVQYKYARTALVTRDISPVAIGSQAEEAWLSSSLFPRVCLSKRYSAMPDLGDPRIAQVGCMVTQFFVGFHLLIQIMSPNEVTQMGVISVSGQFVQFQ